MNAHARIFAVVVTFHPEEEALRTLLKALAPQVSGVIIVDNNPEADTSIPALIDTLGASRVRLIRLNENLGIATALNVGIAKALEDGAEYVLLSDQDSLPDGNMVSTLLRSIQTLMQSGHRVAAIGPTYKDLNTGITFPFQVAIRGKIFYGHQLPTPQCPTIRVLTLITSGTLIPAETLREVGLMREDFFIDHVDIEWCHRATGAGYELWGTSSTHLLHRLGERSLRVWYFGWRNESAYSPLRMYYRIRNFVALCRIRHIPLSWKIRSAWYSIGIVYVQVCYGRQRSATCSMVARAVLDGLHNRMGAYDVARHHPEQKPAAH